MDNEPKDQNVLTFMMDLVQQKHGDDIEIDFLNSEADKLYNQFGDMLVSYFEPMLTEEQKQQFDQLIESNADQEQVLEFLMSSITELDLKIQQVLLSFRNSYLNS
jgi:hypothetical protein